jgi:hypothetical protein
MRISFDFSIEDTIVMSWDIEIISDEIVFHRVLIFRYIQHRIISFSLHCPENQDQKSPIYKCHFFYILSMADLLFYFSTYEIPDF